MSDTKKKFRISRGENVSYTAHGNSGSVQASFKWSRNFSKRMSRNFGTAQEFVDSECIRLMAPETPFRTGILVNAATNGTVIGSGHIVQDTPYARRQYYEHKERSRWFERMVNRHKDEIEEGANKIAAME